MLKGKMKFMVPVLVVALIASGFVLGYNVRPAFAYITLEVNPNLTLTVDARNRVLAVELGEGKAQEIFTGMSFRNMQLEKALETITTKIEAAGLLTPERRVLLTAHPAPGTSPEQLKPLLERAQAVMKVHIHETATAVPVGTVVASAALAEAGRKLGVLPSLYAELVAEGISHETLVTLFAQLTGEGISAKRFRKEIKDIAESLLDMREEGISEATALQVLQKAIKADPSLSEVTTLVADFIDLIESGFTPEQAMAAVTMAIAADPTLSEHSTIVSVLIDLREMGVSGTDALAKVQAAIASDPTLGGLDDLIEKRHPETRGRALGRNKDKDRSEEERDDKYEEDDKDEDKDEDKDTGLTTVPTAITMQRASEIALTAVPGGTIIEVSSDKDRGRVIWEVLIRRADGTGVEVYIDATTGEILKQKTVKVPASAAPDPATAITMQRASEIALTAVLGGTIIEVSSGRERGRATWEVLIRKANGSGVEIYVDATTGEILKQERVPAGDF